MTRPRAGLGSTVPFSISFVLGSRGSGTVHVQSCTSYPAAAMAAVLVGGCRGGLGRIHFAFMAWAAKPYSSLYSLMIMSVGLPAHNAHKVRCCPSCPAMHVAIGDTLLCLSGIVTNRSTSQLVTSLRYTQAVILHKLCQNALAQQL